MGATMMEAGLRTVENVPTSIDQAPAEIDILEPNWKKLLVEAADARPSGAVNCETGSRRLLDRLPP